MSLNKPFKIDLGLGDLWGTQKKTRKTIKRKKPTKKAKTRYVVFTESAGTQIPHNFSSEGRARAFYELARVSPQYDRVARPRLLL